jgi:hypothetical protein
VEENPEVLDVAALKETLLTAEGMGVRDVERMMGQVCLNAGRCCCCLWHPSTH